MIEYDISFYNEMCELAWGKQDLRKEIELLQYGEEHEREKFLV